MKKLSFIAILISALLFVACGTYRSLDLSQISVGMSKGEVTDLLGESERVLEVNKSSEGYVEILEYSTPKNEVYALEFLNGYLKGYEFLYKDENTTTTYISPYYSPYYYDRHPIIIVPNRPKPSPLPKPLPQKGNGLGQTLPTLPNKQSGDGAR